jgi:hypothetical protein
VLNDVRLGDRAAGFGSSGGAIYMMTFGTRRKLRAALAANGYRGHDTAESS